MAKEHKIIITGDISDVLAKVGIAEDAIEKLSDNQVAISVDFVKGEPEKIRAFFKEIANLNPKIPIQFQYMTQKKILEDEIDSTKELLKLREAINKSKAGKEDDAAAKQLRNYVKDISKQLEEGVNPEILRSKLKQALDIKSYITKNLGDEMSGEFEREISKLRSALDLKGYRGKASFVDQMDEIIGGSEGRIESYEYALKKLRDMGAIDADIIEMPASVGKTVGAMEEVASTMASVGESATKSSQKTVEAAKQIESSVESMIGSLDSNKVAIFDGITTQIYDLESDIDALTSKLREMSQTMSEPAFRVGNHLDSIGNGHITDNLGQIIDDGINNVTLGSGTYWGSMLPGLMNWKSDKNVFSIDLSKVTNLLRLSTSDELQDLNDALLDMTRMIVSKAAPDLLPKDGIRAFDNVTDLIETYEGLFGNLGVSSEMMGRFIDEQSDWLRSVLDPTKSSEENISLLRQYEGFSSKFLKTLGIKGVNSSNLDALFDSTYLGSVVYDMAEQAALPFINFGSEESAKIFYDMVADNILRAKATNPDVDLEELLKMHYGYKGKKTDWSKDELAKLDELRAIQDEAKQKSFEELNPNYSAKQEEKLAEAVKETNDAYNERTQQKNTATNTAQDEISSEEKLKDVIEETTEAYKEQAETIEQASRQQALEQTQDKKEALLGRDTEQKRADVQTEAIANQERLKEAIDEATDAQQKQNDAMRELSTSSDGFEKVQDQVNDSISAHEKLSDVSQESVSKINAEKTAIEEATSAYEKQEEKLNDISNQHKEDSDDDYYEKLYGSIEDVIGEYEKYQEAVSESEATVANKQEEAIGNINKVSEAYEKQADAAKEANQERAKESETKFTDENRSARASAENTSSKINSETQAAQEAANAFRDAAVAKKEFTRSNKEAGSSADSTSKKVDKEAESFDNVKNSASDKKKTESLKKEADNIYKDLDAFNSSKQKALSNLYIKDTTRDGVIGSQLTALNRLKEEYNNVTVAAQKFISENKDNSSASDYIGKISSKLQELKAGMSDAVADNFGKAIEKQLDVVNNALSRNDITDEFRSKLNSVKIELESMKGDVKDIDFSTVFSGEASQDVQNLTNKLEDFGATLKDIGSTTTTLATNKGIQTLLQKVQKDLGYGNLSGGIREQYGELRRSLEEALGTGQFGNISKSALDNFEIIWRSLNGTIKETNQNTKGFFQQFSGAVTSQSAQFLARYFSLQDLIRYGRELVSTVTDVDSAMIELAKVSDASDVRLEESFKKSTQTAQEMGATVTDVINSTSDWARLGYNVDQAEELARITQLYQTVGDNMTQESASQSLISTIKGFQMDTSEAESIVDSVNEVANNFAIDTAGIGEALQRSAAAFSASGTDLNKSIALVTTANAVVQDPASVGTVFKTLSARIRGSKVELQELGEEEDSFTQSTSKLRDLVKGLTGFDIMKDENTYKDIYDILYGIGQQWDNLSDIDRSALAEALGGKRAANALFAVLQNTEDLERAYQTALNSEGSAMREHERYSKSVQFSIDQAKASLQELSVNFLSSDLLKGMIDGGNAFLQILNQIVGTLGSIPSILGALGGLDLLKGLLGADSLVKSVSDAAVVGMGAQQTGTLIGNIGSIIKKIGENRALRKAATEAGGGIAEEAAESAMDVLAEANSIAVAKKVGEAGTKAGASFGSKFAAAMTGSGIAPVIAAVGAAALTIGAVSIYDNKKKAKIDSARTAASEWDYAKDSLEGYISRLKEIDTKLNASDITESQRLVLTQEIYSIQQAISAEYGKAAEGVSLVNSELESQIDQLSTIEQKLAKNNLRDNAGDYATMMKELSKNQVGDGTVITGEILRGTDLAKTKREVGNQIRDIIDSAGIESLKVTDDAGFFGGGALSMAWDKNSKHISNDVDLLLAKLSDLRDAYEYEEGDNSDAIGVIDSAMANITKITESARGVYEDNKAAIDEILDAKFIAKGGADLARDVTEASNELNAAILNGDDKMVEKAIEKRNTSIDAMREMVASSKDVDFRENFDTEQYIKSLSSDLDEGALHAYDFNRALTKGTARAGSEYEETAKSIREMGDAFKELRMSDVDAKQLFDAENLEGAALEYQEILRTLAESAGYVFGDSSSENKQVLEMFWREMAKGENVVTSLDDKIKSYTADVASFKNEMSNEVANVDALNAALVSSFSGKGLSYSFDENGNATGDLVTLMNAYSGLDEYSPGNMFIKTANGIKVNTKELRKLQRQQESITKEKFAKKQADLMDQYTEALEANRIAAEQGLDLPVSDLTLKGLQDAIDQIGLLKSEYDGATSAYQNWINAQSKGEAGDMFEAIRSTALSRGDELLKNGDVGTREFRAIAELMSGLDLTEATTEEVISAYQGVDKVIEGSTHTIRDFFQEGTAGTDAFVETLRDLNFAEIEDGLATFGQLNTKEIADAIGTSVDVVESMFGKLIDKGFDITWYSEDQAKALEAAQGRLQETKDVLDTIEYNGKPMSEALGLPDVSTLETVKDIRGELSKVNSILDSSHGSDFTQEQLSALMAYKGALEETLGVMQTASGVGGLAGSFEVAYTALDQLGARMQFLSSTGMSVEMQLNDAEVQAKIDEIANADPEVKVRMGLDKNDTSDSITRKILDGKWDLNAEINAESGKGGILTTLKDLKDGNVETTFKESGLKKIVSEYEKLTDKTVNITFGDGEASEGTNPLESIAQQATSNAINNVQNKISEVASAIKKSQADSMYKTHTASSELPDNKSSGHLIIKASNVEVDRVASFNRSASQQGEPLQAVKMASSDINSSKRSVADKNALYSITGKPLQAIKMASSDLSNTSGPLVIKAGNVELDQISAYNRSASQQGEPLKSVPVTAEESKDFKEAIKEQAAAAKAQLETTESQKRVAEAQMRQGTVGYNKDQRLAGQTKQKPQFELEKVNKSADKLDDSTENTKTAFSGPKVQASLKRIKDGVTEAVNTSNTAFSNVGGVLESAGSQLSANVSKGLSAGITQENKTQNVVENTTINRVKTVTEAASNVGTKVQDAVQHIKQQVDKAELQTEYEGVMNITPEVEPIPEPEPATQHIDREYDPPETIVANAKQGVNRYLANDVPTTAPNAIQNVVRRVVSDVPTIVATAFQNVVRRVIGGGNLNGTVVHGGGAFADGSTKKKKQFEDVVNNPANQTDKSETALTGEVGQELVVYGNQWWTVGDHGAEFADIPKGAVVFDAEQTKKLLNNGYISGRGKAYLSGTAYATGRRNDQGSVVSGSGRLGNSWGTNTYAPSPSPAPAAAAAVASSAASTANSAAKTADSTEKAADKADEFKETLDEIEILLDRFDRRIEHIDKTAQAAYNTFATRNNAIIDELSLIDQQIKNNMDGYNRYIQQANSVGLDEGWASKVREGRINIEDVTNEDLWDQIQDYQTWYEKALDCLDAVDELKDTQADLDKQRFDNLKQEYEDIIDGFEHLSNVVQKFIDLTEEENHVVATEYYSELIKYENNQLDTLIKEREQLNIELESAVAKGRIKVNSEEFDDMKASIDAVTESIMDAQRQIVEFNNAIRQLKWDQFDRGQEWISDLSEELQFLNDLLDTGNAYDKQGRVTNEGIARYGTMAMDYDTVMRQAEYYASEVKKINKDLAKDPYNLALIDRKRELVKAQQESILAAKKEKEAMRDLVKEGIDKQIEALEKLISDYTSLLDNDQDALDYARQVAEQQREIDKYRKQVNSWQGDDSEEGAARRQKTAEELRQAEEELAQTQEDRRIAEIKASLAELQDNYNEVLNSRLDDINALIAAVIDGVNMNAGTINDTITTSAADVGYNISTNLSTSLSTAKDALISSIGSANTATREALTALGNKFQTLVSNFEKGSFKNTNATILQSINNIFADVEAMAYTAKQEAAKRIAEEQKRKAEAEARARQAAQAQAAKQAQEAAARAAAQKAASAPQQAPANNNNQRATVTDDVKRHVAAAIWNGNYGWGVDPDRARKLTEVFGANNGIQALVNQGVGMTGINPAGYSYTEMRKKFKGYAKGIKKIDRDQVAITQEEGREFVMHNGKMLTPLSEGDSVFNRLASDNLWNFANRPEDFITSKIGNLASLGGISNYGGNNVNMTFNLSGMTDPETFMTELQHNAKFTELVQELTLGRASGHGMLVKNSIRF